MAENENLSANIEVSIDVNESSLRNAEERIQKIGSSAEKAVANVSADIAAVAAKISQLSTIQIGSDAKTGISIEQLGKGLKVATEEAKRLGKELIVIDTRTAASARATKNGFGYVNSERKQQSGQFISTIKNAGAQFAAPGKVDEGFIRKQLASGNAVIVLSNKAVNLGSLNSQAKPITDQINFSTGQFGASGPVRDKNLAQKLSEKSLKEIAGVDKEVAAFLSVIQGGKDALHYEFENLVETLQKANLKLEMDTRTGAINLVSTNSTTSPAVLSKAKNDYRSTNNYEAPGIFDQGGIDAAVLAARLEKIIGGKYNVGTYTLHANEGPAGVDRNGFDVLKRSAGAEYASGENRPQTGHIVNMEQEAELLAKTFFNDLATRLARFVSVPLVENAANNRAHVLGGNNGPNGAVNDTSDFAVPLELAKAMMSNEPLDKAKAKEQGRLAADFVPGKDGVMIISPAMFAVALESAMGDKANAHSVRTERNDAAFGYIDNVKQAVDDVLNKFITGGLARVEQVIEQTLGTFNYAKAMDGAAQKGRTLDNTGGFEVTDQTGPRNWAMGKVDNKSMDSAINIQAQGLEQEIMASETRLNEIIRLFGSVDEFINNWKQKQTDEYTNLAPLIAEIESKTKGDPHLQQILKDAYQGRIEQVFYTIAKSADTAAASTYRGQFAENAGVGTDSDANLERYSQSGMGQAFNKGEAQYGLEIGTFGSHAKSVLGAKPTNRMPYDIPFMVGAGTSENIDGMAGRTLTHAADASSMSDINDLIKENNKLGKAQKEIIKSLRAQYDDIKTQSIVAGEIVKNVEEKNTLDRQIAEALKKSEEISKYGKSLAQSKKSGITSIATNIKEVEGFSDAPASPMDQMKNNNAMLTKTWLKSVKKYVEDEARRRDSGLPSLAEAFNAPDKASVGANDSSLLKNSIAEFQRVQKAQAYNDAQKEQRRIRAGVPKVSTERGDGTYQERLQQSRDLARDERRARGVVGESKAIAGGPRIKELSTPLFSDSSNFEDIKKANAEYAKLQEEQAQIEANTAKAKADAIPAQVARAKVSYAIQKNVEAKVERDAAAAEASEREAAALLVAQAKKEATNAKRRATIAKNAQAKKDAAAAEIEAQAKIAVEQAVKPVNKNVRFQDRVAKAAAEKESEAPKVTEAVVQGVVNGFDLNALKKLWEDKTADIRKVLGSAVVDGVFAFMEESIIKGGGKVSAAWDTEYNSKLSGTKNNPGAIGGTILESSVVLKNAAGKFKDVLTFMHIPAFSSPEAKGQQSRLNIPSMPDGGPLSNLSKLYAQAKKLGIATEDLGNQTDFKKNAQELGIKVDQLQALFKLLDILQVTLHGHNINTADFGNLKTTIGFVEKVTGVPKAVYKKELVQDSLKNVQAAKKIATQFDPISGVLAQTGKTPTGMESTKLSHLVYAISKELPADLEKYSDILSNITKEGFTVKIDGKSLPAHSAMADAVVSIIVHEVLSKAEHSVYQKIVDGTQQIPKTTQSKSTKSEKTFDTTARAEQGAAAHARGVDEYTQEEKMAKVNANGQSSRAKTQTEELIQQQAKLANIAVLYEKVIEGYKLGKAAIGAVNADLNEMLNTHIKLQGTSDKELAQAKSIQLIQDKLNKAAAGDASINVAKELYKLKVLLNDEYGKSITLIKHENNAIKDKYHDVTPSAVHLATQQTAGPAFTGSIKAQMTEAVKLEKEAERSSKNLVSTWVTARYALYDVANAYQNVSRNLVQVTRQVFNLVDAYRAYETAFTPVERSMQLLTDETRGVLEQFIALSEQLPISVEELSRVATLGAQMGVAADGIVNFTKVVAEFSAITAISADTVAQKFGRIAELTNLDYSQLENLASSIALAGVNAVATETEILNLSEGISAVSSRVGILPQQVVGLGTALASTGVQAEQARGVFTRVFAKIDRAVGQGGTSLDAFAKAAGVSSKDFAANWGEAGKSYELFRGILESVNASGKNATAMFDGLGLRETREVNTLTRLAKNLNVVDKSMSDATKAFEDNTFLADSFAKNVDNLDSKIIIFQNNLKSLGEQLSKSVGANLAGKGGVLDNLSELAKVFKVLASTASFQFLTVGTIATIAFGAAATGIVAVLAKITAQIYAFRVAMINTANDPTAMGGFGRQIKSLIGFKSELTELRTGLTNNAVRGKVDPIVYPVRGTSNDQGKFDYLMKNANTYRATGKTIQEAIDAEAVSLGKLDKVRKFSQLSGFEQIQMAREEARQITMVQKAREAELVVFRKRMGEDLDAFKADQLSRSTPDTKDIVDTRITNQEQLVAAKIAEAEATKINYEQVGKEIKGYTIEQQLNAQAIVNGEVMASVKDKEAAARIVNSKAVDKENQTIATAGKGALGGVGARVMGIAGGLMTGLATATVLFTVIEGITASIKEASDYHILEGGGGLASLRAAIYADTTAYKKNGEAIGLVKSQYKTYKVELNSAGQAIKNATGVNVALNKETGKSTTNIKMQTLALGENTKAWLANALATNEKVKSLFDLNPNLLDDAAAIGVDFNKIVTDMMNPDIPNPLQSVYTTITDLKKRIAEETTLTVVGKNAMPLLSDTGKALQAQLDKVEKLKLVFQQMKGALNSALGMSQFQETINGILGVGDAATTAEKPVDKLAKSVKTLTSWAGEVKGVMDAAFNFRFGKQQALDSVNGKFLDMKKAAKEAQTAIKATKNTIDSLTADRGALQAQLEVAIRYGDTVRANIIQAKLNAKDAELADTKAQLASQESAQSKDLTGNTEENIAARNSILELASSYDVLIESILNSGDTPKVMAKNIEKLKKQFVARAIELGFDPKEIETYVKTFNDKIKIVKEIPLDVTVSVKGLSAAERAIKEFVAQANADIAEIKLPNLGPAKYPVAKDPKKLTSKNQAAAEYGGSIGTADVMEKFYNVILQSAQISTLTSKIEIATAYAKTQKKADAAERAWNIVSKLQKEKDALLKKATDAMKSSSIKKAAGGYIAGQGSGTSDSIPAMLSNGEYVIKAKAVSQYGLSFMNALNQQRVGQSPVQSSNAGPQASGGNQMVYLSPDDRALLRAALDRPITLYTENTKIAQSANAGNVTLAQRGVK